MESPYLEGAYAPVDREIEAELVAREGAIPDDVAGSYVRNGPNPRFRAEGGQIKDVATYVVEATR